INECASYPCINSGNCTNTDGSYSCNCSHGWEGVNCENVISISDINECASYPCINSGNCTNTDGSYSCNCSHGWEGVNCEN
ncbi:hypothetical protein ACJMK2_023846, partial [Sinanodonta woodiana]